MMQVYPKPNVLVEPFAGGGIISFTALFENLVERVVMVELDDEIAAVWESVVNGDVKWLANRILDFNLTKQTVIQEIKKTPKTQREKAFQTILKNRTFHGEYWLRVLDFLNMERTAKAFFHAGILPRLPRGL
jgi:DNA adenine methylase